MASLSILKWEHALKQAWNSLGSINVFGENLLSLPPTQRAQLERRFGVLFQQGALFSSLTITENVALPLIENAGLSRFEGTPMNEVVKAFGLANDQLAEQMLNWTIQQAEAI